MKKKILSVMIFTLSLCTMGNVQAEEEPYFVTYGGVELTEYQYNTLVDILSEERVKTITEDDYNALHVERMIKGRYSYKTEEYEIEDPGYPSEIEPYAYHETASKKLTLSRFCSDNICSVGVTAYWKKVPSVKSYDVIGVRFENTSYYGIPSFYYGTTTGGTTSYDKSIKTSNGAAFIKKVTSDVDYFALDVDFNYTYNGIVFASYQHATSSVTLAQASNFQFKGTGYGGVFLWPMSIRTKYDQMGGVSETLANL